MVLLLYFSRMQGSEKGFQRGYAGWLSVGLAVESR